MSYLFLPGWLIAGIVGDLLFLLQCWLMYTGRVGKVLQVNFMRDNRFWGLTTAVIIPCIVGIIFPPYIIGGLIYFVVRVAQERKRLREFGRG